MKKISFILTILIFSLSSLLSAQNLSPEDRFFYGTEADDDLALLSIEKSFQTKGFQYGAVFSPVFIYEKDSGSSLTSAVLNLRVWGKMYLMNNSFIYARVKESYLAPLVDTGTAYANVESDNLIDLDLAYFSYSSDTGSLTVSAGRKYYSLGTGLVLNGRGDGADIAYLSKIFNVRAFGMYSGFMVKESNPYGLSLKYIADGAERVFTGGEVSADISNHVVYLFGMAQIDLADEDKTARTSYNSQYYGAGINGVLLKDFAYYAEFIYETGKSYVTDTNDEASISAYAVNTGINYYLPVKLNPVLILQYAHGSGDKYRTDYKTGNRGSADGDDKGFIYFGTFSGGFALKPTLNNIHIFRTGFSFAPFSEMEQQYLKRISASAKYSYYMKDIAESPIKSGAADEDNKHIGHGVDLSLRWQIFMDMSFYVNYGIFIPGDAYSKSQEDIHYIQSGFNFSF